VIYTIDSRRQFKRKNGGVELGLFLMSVAGLAKGLRELECELDEALLDHARKKQPAPTSD